MLLYIHIPFCDSKCFYCSFNSYTNLHDKIDSYMKSLTNSLKWHLEHFNVGFKSIESIFIGGGTPSVVDAKYYKELFELLHPYKKENIEITTEANPNSATLNWLEGMKNLGVNRVSFGVQSFNENKLKALNRAHSKKDAINAINYAKRVGINNISIDLIYDFLGDSKELIKADLDLAFSLPINHISTYELTIERGTNFYKRPEVKSNNETLGFFVRDEIVNRGFDWYEVSNYGVYKSRHNLGYWQYKNYLGIGAGAVGFINNTRYYPHTNIELFIKEPNYFKKEILSAKDMLTEKIFLGLRSIVGINSDLLTKDMKNRADVLVNEGKLEFKNNRYFNKDFFLSDELALFIEGY